MAFEKVLVMFKPTNLENVLIFHMWAIIYFIVNFSYKEKSQDEMWHLIITIAMTVEGCKTRT